MSPSPTWCQPSHTHNEERQVAIYVTEPRKREGMKVPVRVYQAYQRGGSQHSTLQNLVDNHWPEAIYYSDDEEADFGPDQYEAWVEAERDRGVHDDDICSRETFYRIVALVRGDS